MFCSKCGKEISDEALICPGCGCPVENSREQNCVSSSQMAERTEASSLGLVSVILGIVGIVMGLLLAFLGYAFGGGALVCALFSLKKYPGDKKGNTGMILAIVSLACAVLNSIFGIIMMI